MNIRFLISFFLLLSLQGFGQSTKEMEIICQSILDDQKFIKALDDEIFRCDTSFVQCVNGIDSLFNLTYLDLPVYKLKKKESSKCPKLSFRFPNKKREKDVIVTVTKFKGRHGCLYYELLTYSCYIKKKGNEWKKKKVNIVRSEMIAKPL